MGVDIFYFVDHDLSTNSAKNFMDELNRRTGSESTWEFLYNEDAGSFENCFPNLQGDIEMTFSDADLNVELNLAKHVLMIWNLKKSWQTEVNYCRWWRMNQFFAEEIEYAKEWKEKMTSQIKEVLVPIFHSTKVLLAKDSSSYEHECLWSEYLLENGDTIEEALSRNAHFEHPCEILRNDEAFGHSKEVQQAFYVFDL